jgi:Fe-S-cluster containining protein
MATDSPAVVCRRCGLCCRKLIIEINCLDVLREERLMIAKQFSHAHGPCGIDEEETLHEGSCRLLACGPNHPCPMLADNGTCTIYPTRPNVCVGFLPGSAKCRQSRKAAKRVRP